MPSVDTIEEAHELVAGQDSNENLDLNQMPFDHTYEPAEGQEPPAGAAERKERPAD